MTPDKERLIPGVMWDAAGKNITRKQIADIPGAVPTVVVGSGETGQSSSTEALVAALALQVSVIPLSVLDHEDQGQSTRSALALLSKPADELVSAWRAGSVNDPPSPEAAERLWANMAIAQAIGLKGTPTFIWRRPGGAKGRIDGIPMSIDALVSSIGS
jgi:thiol:disulfide interchange protein DsbG